MKPIIKAVDFLNVPRVDILNDHKYRLAIRFVIAVLGKLIIIPEGFETDLASVPRLPFFYILLGNKGKWAAILHDWLYSTNMFPREVCDYYFYLALRETGMGYIKANLFYTGVKVGGQRAYDGYTMALEEQLKIMANTKKENVVIGERIVEAIEHKREVEECG
jgi:hypothetical protein